MNSKYQKLKYACYSVSICMSIVCNLPPLLFTTFRSAYGISYTLLGMLIVVNFLTQLTVDLIFSFFSHKFNIPKSVKMTPVLTLTGLLIYTLTPAISPQYSYIGFVIGTIIFSAASGLAEVLISPVIAAIPADDPEREMSKLHSVYAWGVVPVVIISTLFLLIFGSENWQALMGLFMIVPVLSICLFIKTEIPQMETPKKTTGALKYLKSKGIWLFFAAIFFGGAAECNMAQWASGYIEKALKIPKIWGDVFGVALFSLMLGIGRTAYAKRGKNIEKTLLLSAIGATLCYLITVTANNPVIGLSACAFTGFCTAMLWPGSLIVASDCYAETGVFIYALMAAGGDLGASVAPQLVGIITDSVIASPAMNKIAQTLSLMPEQLGMKMGMFAGMLFPLASIPIFLHIYKNRTQK